MIDYSAKLGQYGCIPSIVVVVVIVFGRSKERRHEFREGGGIPAFVVSSSLYYVTMLGGVCGRTFDFCRRS